MNQKKAKALRKAVGFRPSEPREYKGDFVRSGKPRGTLTSTGPRMQYQRLKSLIAKGLPMNWSAT